MKLIRLLPGAGIRSSIGTMGAAAVTLIQDDINIMIDTGHFGSRDKLLARLKAVGLSPGNIDVVVLTHINWDHCLNVDLFRDSRIAISRKELEEGWLSGVPDGFTAKFREMLKEMDLLLVSDGQRISSSTSIIYTPGHTPGHISLLVDGSPRIIIAGDAVPNLRAYRRGVPDLIFFDLSLAKSSIERIKSLKPDYIIPGHDSPFNDAGYVERDNVDIILRKENEENLVITISNVEADKPIVYRDK
ncbi:MAG: MBL fold metallo-hydrolase [Thermocladium sp.]